MPAVIEAIDKMSVREKFETANYIWSSLAQMADQIPAWHEDELAKTATRVAEGLEHPILWSMARAAI